MTGPLIDPEGRCERCGRLVPIECPEPDGLACGSYVLGAELERLDQALALTAEVLERGRVRIEAARLLGVDDPGSIPHDEAARVVAGRNYRDEEAFFAAMDDIVEHVTGERPEPPSLDKLMGQLPVTVAVQVAVDLREARYDAAIRTAGQHGVDLRAALGFRTSEPPGARGCEADDQGPEDGAF